MNRTIVRRSFVDELSTSKKFSQIPRRRKSGNCRSFQVPEFDTQPHSDKSAATADGQDDCQEECLRWAVHLEEVQPVSGTEAESEITCNFRVHS